MKKIKKIPRFKTEDEEREFWATHDTTDYFDMSKLRRVSFPNLKPSTEVISLRMPAGLLADIKALANRQDVPYQSLMKVFLDRETRHELHERRAAYGPEKMSSKKRGGR